MQSNDQQNTAKNQNLADAALGAGKTAIDTNEKTDKRDLDDAQKKAKDKDKSTPNEVREGTSNRADFHHGSTTQGGSNFGQGSSNLGRYGNAQGSESSDGANYGNEKGWNNEALRREDDAETPPNK